MKDTLCAEADFTRYPSLQRICRARESGKVSTPKQAAESVLSILPELENYPNGSFIDIREIIAPEEYAELMHMQERR